MIDAVLVPHDLSDWSDRGLEALQALGLGYRHLHVLHVLPRVDFQYPGVVWPKDEDEARRAHALEALRVRLAGTAFADATVHVTIGDPGPRVIELAREIGAGLIVLPSHGRRGLALVAARSVADHASRFAPCPVLVIPPVAEPHPHATPAPAPSRATGRSRADVVDALGSAVSDRVAKEKGYLVSLRIAVPAGGALEWWEDAIEARLAEAGIDYVDTVVERGAGPDAEILDARFEERWG